MSRPTPNRRPRGGATVELAVMMVFLIPLFLYFLFLQDLLFYKLEMQETIVTTPWDYNFLDYNQAKLGSSSGGAAPAADDNADPGDQPSGGGGYDPQRDDLDETVFSGQQAPPSGSSGVDSIVARQSRRTYCDHTSAYDSYSTSYDCADQVHHTALAAHQCWLTANGDADASKKARQVTCQRTKDDFTARTPLARGFNDDFNAGGVMLCEARLGVTNYFLPNKFFDFWSKKEVTTMKRFQTGTGTTAAHQNAEGVSASESIIFAAQAHSVLQDTWAVNRPDEITPDTGPGLYRIKVPSRFRERMLKYWNPGGVFLFDARQWHNAMGREKLLSQASQMDPIGDHLSTPPLAWKPKHQREFGESTKHYTSGWVDPRHQAAYGARQPHYFAQQDGYK